MGLDHGKGRVKWVEWARVDSGVPGSDPGGDESGQRSCEVVLYESFVTCLY